MNRFSPLIVRRVGRFAHPAIYPPAIYSNVRDAAPSVPSIAEDLKIFATSWLGGLVFFATFLS